MKEQMQEKTYRGRGITLLLSLPTALCFALGILGVSHLTAQFSLPWYAPAIASGVLLLLALLAHNLRFAGRAHYAFAACLNGAAAGAASATYFARFSLSPSLTLSLAAAAVLPLVALITALLGRLTDGREREDTVIAALLFLAWLGGLIALIILWCTSARADLRPALLTFAWCFSLFLLIASYTVRDEETDEAFRGSSFWSFGAALTVLLVVGLALALADGDCDCDLDGCDSCDCPGGNGKKKPKKGE